MSNRKLQSEIERTLKKVQEGIELFESIIDKLHSPLTNNQKEKYELDLKKEIKKLQRQRDQIKAWLLLNEIKDKDQLTEYRRLIEVQMEKFKICEREMKTKAYSKEGLSITRIDPKEKEKNETMGWISSALDRLSTQVDSVEVEIESLSVALRKKKSNDKTERKNQLEHRLTSHKSMIEKLEVMLRLLENGRIMVDDVLNIKDDVEYYIESNDDPDFVEDDTIFDQIDLLNDDSHDHSIEEEQTSASDNDESDEEAPQPPVKTAVEKNTTPNNVTEPKPSANQSTTSSTSTESKDKETIAVSTTKPTAPMKIKATITPSIHPNKPAPSTAPPPKVVNPAQVWANAPKIIASAASAANVEPAKKPVARQPSIEEVKPQVLPVVKQDISFSEIVAAGAKEHRQEIERIPECVKPHYFDDLSRRLDAIKKPIGQALENSFVNIPDAYEIDKSKQYIPKNPCDVPNYYPSNPPSIFENPALFERFDIDTLFFIFYYQQRTLQQYFAARELKKQSWRFHKKYLTWFQRHEEPKSITDDYEQGTYIYFDYEGSWCQRKKTEFTFEYRFLEDLELV